MLAPSATARDSDERATGDSLPLGVKFFLAVLGWLMAVILVLHPTGHGLYHGPVTEMRQRSPLFIHLAYLASSWESRPYQERSSFSNRYRCDVAVPGLAGRMPLILSAGGMLS